MLDANILVRAVLGRRVREILTGYASAAAFFAPDVAYAEAQEHLPKILAFRRIPASLALAILDDIATTVHSLDCATYAAFEQEAKARLIRRDCDDWPILAASLALNCPIWTEDSDFFGCGVPTWTTDRVELFLRGPHSLE